MLSRCSVIAKLAGSRGRRRPCPAAVQRRVAGRGRRAGDSPPAAAPAAAWAALAGAVLLAAAGSGCSRAPAGVAGAAGAAGASGRPSGQLQPADSATFPRAAAAATPADRQSLAAPRPSPAAGLAPAQGPTRPLYVGVILARQAVNVAADADGRLASIAVRVGDPVRRGQELAVLSTEELRNEQAVVQATVSAARGEQRRAELELERTHDRRARREVHPELYSDEDLAGARNAEQEAIASLDSAKARVAEEMGHLRQLETRLQHTVLRSPIDGRVALRYLDAGALVHSGAPVLRLISANDFLLRFAVPPEQAAAIHQGAAVEVRLDSLPVSLQARVSQVTPRIDPASQMVFVEAELQVPGAWVGRLQDGLPGRVALRG